MLDADGRSAVRATFHVLLACTPHDSAPPGHTWSQIDIVIFSRQESAPLFKVALDAVRQLPDTASPELAQEQPAAPVPMEQLEQQARAANAMLRNSCLDTQAPPWQPGLFAEWGDRIPVLGIPAAVGSTSCREPFHLPHRCRSASARGNV
jgi:hypothetical protein